MPDNGENGALDVVTFGEALIDLAPASPHVMESSELDEAGSPASPLYAAHPGGAPANVAVGLARLGCRAGFIGKVGRDGFGRLIGETLRVCGVDTGGLVWADGVATTLVIVDIGEGGERSFTFHRNPGADSTLTPEEVPLASIERAAVFHFGSVSLTREPARAATLRALAHARRSRCLISFDPNVRLSLWDSPEAARQAIFDCLPMVDVLKVSDEELTLLTGERDAARGADRLQAEFSVPLLFVTLGKNGCYYRHPTREGYVPAPDVQAVDTTGAGDAFVAGVLSQLSARWVLSRRGPVDLPRIARFANAVAALSTTRRGGIPAMPTRSEVDELLGQWIEGGHTDAADGPGDRF
ncbi:carbohydrate kinase [Alicyclobacillus sp.]|uniref:carbohydrate kinase family protein n=1 Tax=Alicyclobacillus sp. TaxID=61169 RepID=UPI0025C21E4A|nr:carbohydrate kinase [Alicyclobacillus sp.]